VQLVQTQPDDIGRGLTDGLVGLELLAEVAGREAGMAFFLVSGEGAVEADPAAFPVEVVEQAHAPAVGRAPGGLALSGPSTHLSVAAGAAAQWRPAVAHVHQLRRADLAGVPQVAFVSGQLFGGRPPAPGRRFAPGRGPGRLAHSSGAGRWGRCLRGW
jgi:hypothetical protein